MNWLDRDVPKEQKSPGNIEIIFPGRVNINLTRGATRIDTEVSAFKILNWLYIRVFPSLLLISNALSVGDAFSLTDFPQKPSLHN